MTFEEWFEKHSGTVVGGRLVTSKSSLMGASLAMYEDAQPKWQSMLTAPKDRIILLLTKQDDVATGYWDCGSREEYGEWKWFDGEPIYQDLVGWMYREVLVR